MADNQGQVCDAIVRVLEAHSGLAHSEVEHPEKTGDPGPVDLVFCLGAQQYALEHTKIEAFAGQLQHDAVFGEFIAPVTAELRKDMPKPGTYELLFPIDSRLNARKAELDDLQVSLITWVKAKAQAFREEHPIRQDRDHCPRGIRQTITEQLEGFPYHVTLIRELHWAESDVHDGVIFAGRIAPDDLEALRRERIQIALEKKHKKLQHWKNNGASSLLVLESDDIALTNHALVGECVAALLPQGPDWLDELYFIYTSLDRWTVYTWDWGSSWWREGFAEFDSENLNDICA
jgi:hypothetical protein